MFKPNERQVAILRFLSNNEGLYSALDISQAIGCRLTTALRTDLNILIAVGQIKRQPVSSDNNRLAWGYAAAYRLPEFQF